MPSPFLGSAVLAVDLLSELGDTAVLPDLASGERIGAVAVAGAPGPGGLLEPGGAVKSDGDRLSGHAGPVLDGAAADVLLVLADAADGPRFFLVDAGAGRSAPHAVALAGPDPAPGTGRSRRHPGHPARRRPDGSARPASPTWPLRPWRPSRSG